MQLMEQKKDENKTDEVRIKNDGNYIAKSDPILQYGANIDDHSKLQEHSSQKILTFSVV